MAKIMIKKEARWNQVDKIGKAVTYYHKPITDMVQIYESEFLTIIQDIPEDFFEVANEVNFNSGFLLGWGGFYPNPQEYSESKKFIQYQFSPYTHYKFHLGGVYEYRGELYAHTYWT